VEPVYTDPLQTSRNRWRISCTSGAWLSSCRGAVKQRAETTRLHSYHYYKTFNIRSDSDVPRDLLMFFDIAIPASVYLLGTWTKFAKLWLIIYCFTSRSRIFHLHGDFNIAGEGLQNLGLCSVLRALEQGRGLFRAIPGATRGLGFFGIIRRTAPFSRLLRHTCKGMWRIYSNPDLQGSTLKLIEYLKTLNQIQGKMKKIKSIFLWLSEKYLQSFCLSGWNPCGFDWHVLWR
jgi:hypothetical protein